MCGRAQKAMFRPSAHVSVPLLVQCFEDLWWKWCVSCFEASGALPIKFAQWASSRPDVFGARVCRRFVHLQGRVAEHPWEHTAACLDRMFGAGWRTDLRLERSPVGSGCIAQVHRGWLRQAAVSAGVSAGLSAGTSRGSSAGSLARFSAGASADRSADRSAEQWAAPPSHEWREVAVKVLHPHVARGVAVDVALLRGLGALLGGLRGLRWLNPEAMVDEFCALLGAQLDLRVEADHLERFARDAASDATGEREGPRVLFPSPCWPYVSAEALVETFIRGTPFVQWASALPAERAAEAVALCEQGIDAVVRMIFTHNFVHGDLHPGNIFVVDAAEAAEAGGGGVGPRLAFLDAGLAFTYSPADHAHLVDVLSSFIQYDGASAARLIAEHSLEPDGLRDLDGFAAKIQTMVELARDAPTFFDQLGDCISIICEAACEHHVKMRGSFVSIALAVKVVEGSVIQVDPGAQVATRAKPVVVREHLRRKGRALLGRSLETGELLDDDARKAENAHAESARVRSAANERMNIMEEYRRRHPTPQETTRTYF